MDFIVTTSENATVMPPPVKGWRMLNASPSNTAPGVRDGFAGIVLFRIDLNAPFFTAARAAPELRRNLRRDLRQDVLRHRARRHRRHVHVRGDVHQTPHLARGDGVEQNGRGVTEDDVPVPGAGSNSFGSPSMMMPTNVLGGRAAAPPPRVSFLRNAEKYPSHTTVSGAKYSFEIFDASFLRS